MIGSLIASWLPLTMVLMLGGGPPQESREPRLEGEDLAGGLQALALTELPLADPRERGLWILRPLDFSPPSPSSLPAAQRARVTLVNGDTLSAHVLGGSGETLELELAGGVAVPFDLEALRSLRFPARIPAGQRLALSAPDEGDRLYRLTGALDVVDGTLEGFAPGGVQFDSVLGARTIPWSEVAGLFIEPIGAARGVREEGVPITLDFAGPWGGRVSGRLLSIERASCRMLLGGATEVALPLSAVAEIVVDDGRLTFLSELVPSGEEGRGAPFGDELGMTWPHRMDLNVQGGVLRSNGVVHRRGIGMHAPSRLTFPLDGAAGTLRGRVGIDDGTRVNAAAARGSVLFRVLADGEPLWESPLVRGGDAPLSLPPLDLAGKRELVLEVDPAGDFAGDRANWLGLVLTR